jgi:hypothetical protein
VLDEQSAAERVIANAIAANPGIDKRKGKHENDSQDFLVPGKPNQRTSSSIGVESSVGTRISRFSCY